jgi:hypothetical protein
MRMKSSFDLPTYLTRSSTMRKPLRAALAVHFSITRGKVIGINFAMVREFGGSNFAIPVGYGKRF